MKKISFFSPFKKESKLDEAVVESVSFIVIDDAAKNEAFKIMSKVKFPDTPSFHRLEKSYLKGDWFLRKFKKNEIQIITKKNLTKEEAYQQNVNIFQHLIDQRDAIVGIIEHMVQPMILNIGGISNQLDRHNKRIDILERQVLELQQMMKSVHGKSPTIPKLPNGKMPWSRSIKDAANEIIKNYETDCKAEIKEFRSLRDSSDAFYESHEFTYKQDYTREQLYENVKRANSPWLQK